MAIRVGLSEPETSHLPVTHRPTKPNPSSQRHQGRIAASGRRIDAH